MRKLLRTLYRWGVLHTYQQVDCLRYLKRLASGHGSDDGHYFANKDHAQFTAGGEVLRRFVFRQHPCTMFCRAGSHIEANLLRQPEHALRLTGLAADYLRDGLFVDVGANVGTFSLPLAKAFPANRVLAFEPNPPARQRLQRNLALNGINNVEVRPEGLGQTPGQFTLYGFAGEDLGQSSFLRPTQHREAPMEIEVPVITLDSVLSERAERLDVLKIDVQGQEAAVLQGATQSIARHRPVILLEHEDSNFADAAQALAAKEALEAFFRQHAYEVFYITRKDVNLLFPVRWNSALNGDLLALPRG